MLLAVVRIVSACDSIPVLARHFSGDRQSRALEDQVLQGDGVAVLDLDARPSISLDERLIVGVGSNNLDTGVAVDAQVLRVPERGRGAHVLVQVLVAVGSGPEREDRVSLGWVSDRIDRFLEGVALSVARPGRGAAGCGGRADVHGGPCLSSGQTDESSCEGGLDERAHFLIKLLVFDYNDVISLSSVITTEHLI